MSCILYLGCGREIPASSKIPGVWSTEEGASFHFNEDGNFRGEALPAAYFLSVLEEDVVVFNGSGKWRIERLEENTWDYRLWKIHLSFEELGSNVPDNIKHFNSQVYITKSSPISSSWIIASWEYGDMDGGDLLRFEKQSR